MLIFRIFAHEEQFFQKTSLLVAPKFRIFLTSFNQLHSLFHLWICLLLEDITAPSLIHCIFILVTTNDFLIKVFSHNVSFLTKKIYLCIVFFEHIVLFAQFLYRIRTSNETNEHIQYTLKLRL